MVSDSEVKSTDGSWSLINDKQKLVTEVEAAGRELTAVPLLVSLRTNDMPSCNLSISFAGAARGRNLPQFVLMYIKGQGATFHPSSHLRTYLPGSE